MKRIVLLACCLFPATPALGHGYITYVSTPITPPLEFRWWLPFALMILLVSMVTAFRIVLGQGLRAAAMRALFAVVLFAVSFYVFGSCAANVTTAPLPGLGFPCRTYWGRGWGQCGVTFLAWNLIGVCFLLASISLLACRNQPITKRRKVATVGVVAYLLALTPYVVRGAYLHGWAGGYVQMDCMRRLDELTAAVCDYADAHGGSLPTATGIDELIDVVQPYLKNGVQRFRSIPRAICPVGGAFERTPQKYRWDSKLSGRKLTELNEGTLMDEGMISCPYHQRQGVQSFTRIMKHRDVAASQPSSTPSDARTGMSR